MGYLLHNVTTYTKKISTENNVQTTKWVIKSWNYLELKQQKLINCPVSWGCRKHWLKRGKTTTSSNECPEYNTKQSFLDPLCPGVVAPDMGQKELKCVLMLNWITWNRTVLTFNFV